MLHARTCMLNLLKKKLSYGFDHARALNCTGYSAAAVKGILTE